MKYWLITFIPLLHKHSLTLMSPVDIHSVIFAQHFFNQLLHKHLSLDTACIGHGLHCGVSLSGHGITSMWMQCSFHYMWGERTSMPYGFNVMCPVGSSSCSYSIYLLVEDLVMCEWEHCHTLSFIYNI